MRCMLDGQLNDHMAVKIPLGQYFLSRPYRHAFGIKLRLWQQSNPASKPLFAGCGEIGQD